METITRENLIERLQELFNNNGWTHKEAEVFKDTIEYLGGTLKD
jgi:hypothetical protein